mgnify:CR=1 FL=1|jgi:hypothetical protein
MNLIRGLVTLFIALIMVKLSIDLIMFLFVNNVIAEKKLLHNNLRGGY